MSAPEQDPAVVLEFFDKTIPDQIHLCAIDPEKCRPLVGQDFGTDANAAAEWAVKHNANGFNVYYSVNRVRTGVAKKPCKSDITDVRFAHVDVDPPEKAASFTDAEKCNVEARLLDADPGTIIWSGNGVQALWRLGEGVCIDDVEQINRVLIAALDGDKGTHNADRILRVPGLVNWPDEKKRIIGRKPVLARVQLMDDGVVHDCQQLLAKYSATAKRKPDTSVQQLRASIELDEVTLLTADDLSLPDDAVLRRLIDAPKGLDRSADTFGFTCQALREGLTAQHVVGVLLNGANAISAHCLSQGDPRRAAHRAVERALGEPDVLALARQHERKRERDLAAAEGATDETKIWSLETMLRDCVLIEDGVQVVDTTRPGHVLSQADFKVSTAASIFLAQVPVRGGGKRKIRKKVAEAWLENPARRTVATQTFRAGAGLVTSAPDGRSALNRWRGLRTTIPPGDWRVRVQPFIQHVEWLFGA